MFLCSSLCVELFATEDPVYTELYLEGFMVLKAVVIFVAIFWDFFCEDPIYLQSVIIHSANGGKALRMACRRVLSSTPLLVRGSVTGGDSGETKLTN
jgi:hypothetical protein